MGLKFVEKGSVILTPNQIETIKKSKAYMDCAVSAIHNANGPSKDSQFRDALCFQAEKDANKAVKFLDVLITQMDRAK